MKVNRSRWLGYHWFSGEILVFPFGNSRFSIWKFVVNVIVNNSMHVFFLFENLALTSKMINNVMLHKRWTDIWKKMFGICWTSVKCMVKGSESKRHYVTLMCVCVCVGANQKQYSSICELYCFIIAWIRPNNAINTVNNNAIQ